MSLVTKLYKWQYSPTYTNECGHIWRSSLNYTVIMLIHDNGHQTIQMTMTNKLYRWHCSLNYTLIMLNHDNVHQTIQMAMLTNLYRWRFPPTYTIFELFWAQKKLQKKLKFLPYHWSLNYTKEKSISNCLDIHVH